MRLAWATDIHLNFLDEARLSAFAAEVRAQGADGFVVTGDIAEAPSLVPLLASLAKGAGPCWFVLGNHDYYRSSVDEVREAMRALHPDIGVWLPGSGVVPLSSRTALIGVDGWGDARLGNAASSPLILTDFILIRDCLAADGASRNRKLRELGDAEGRAARALLAEALAGPHEQIVFATHVPPFRDACWHEGRVSNDDWLPFFTCAAVGVALREAAAAHPDRRFTVLCGHTHGEGICHPAPNLTVLTGAAEYGKPVLQTLDFP